MSKLLIVTPSSSMYHSAQEIIEEMELDAKVLMGTSDDTVKAVREELGGETGIIVARGHLARLLRSQLNMPVIEITLSGMDMILLLNQAKRLLNQQRPMIAFIGTRSMFSDCSALADILDVEPRIYLTNDSSELAGKVVQAAQDGAAMIIGGGTSCRHAAQIGIPYLFMDTIKESVREAIRSAVRFQDALTLEQRRAAEFSSLLNYSFDAILRLDEQGGIVSGNFLAERIFRRPISEMVGQPFFDLPAVQITPALREALNQHRSMYSTIIRIGSDSFVANAAAVNVSDTHSGYFISMQEFGIIQQLEETIRAGHRENGHVAKAHFSDFLFRTKAFADIVFEATQYAQYDIPLLIYGPPGQSKAELAQCIHNASLRRQNPFVHADLSTIPPERQTEMLFGSENSSAQKGLISVAHTGTLFLLDVQLLTPENQHQLLNVMRNGRFFRKGSSSPTPVSVRVICSSYKDLRAMAATGSFLEPLANMLASASLTLPPICSAGDELPAIINHCLDKACAKYKKPLALTHDAMQLLLEYSWPDNEREIRTFCERAVMLAPSAEIDGAFLRTHLLPQQPAAPKPDNVVMVVASPEETELRNALRETGGSRQSAAERLGISRSALWRRMKKYGIE